jgi:hypothetical protein
MRAAAVAALGVIERSSAPKTPESALVQETRLGAAASDISSD